jgi:hypothetical protein
MLKRPKDSAPGESGVRMRTTGRRVIFFGPKAQPYRPGGELHSGSLASPACGERCPVHPPPAPCRHEPRQFRGGRAAGVTGVRAAGLRGPPLA